MQQVESVMTEAPPKPTVILCPESQRGTETSYLRHVRPDLHGCIGYLKSLWREAEDISQGVSLSRPSEEDPTLGFLILCLGPDVDDPVSISIERSRYAHYWPLLEYWSAPPALQISYRNPEEVKSYFTRHPEIEGFLETAWPHLIRCFGGAVHIVLEVMTYPEEVPYQKLVGWIQSSDDVCEGLEKLERFDEEWFLDHLDEVNNKFNFNIETK